jgi:dihydroorotate dehydrogenase
VGTAGMISPGVLMEIIGGIEEYLKKSNVNHISELVGQARIM